MVSTRLAPDPDLGPKFFRRIPDLARPKVTYTSTGAERVNGAFIADDLGPIVCSFCNVRSLRRGSQTAKKSSDDQTEAYLKFALQFCSN